MPSKRRPINRSWKPGRFSAEVLTLFSELEGARARGGAKFKANDRKLHRLLGLESEWFCSVCSVLDGRSEGPCRPEGYPAHDDWYRVRAFRQQLLAATEEQRAEPVN